MVYPSQIHYCLLTFYTIFCIVNSLNQSLNNKCPDICICLDIYVDCSQRNIEFVPVLLPDWTERLDLSSNQIRVISSAPLEKLLNLTRLELHKNQLSTLPILEGLPQLKFLSVAFNMINNISRKAIEVLPQLQILDLTGNRIIKLDSNIFPEHNSLSILILNYNQIHEMHVQCFNNLTHLTELKLNRNKINRLPKNLFQNQTKLKLLEINKNQLNAIDGLTFAPLEQLTVLKLKRNKISSLRDGAFYGLKSIGVLELDGNSLSRVSKGWLYGLQKLSVLSLAGNLIKSIEVDAWHSCSDLKELDLSNNRLQEIDRDNLKHLTHLTRLNLNGNEISIIADGAFNNTPRIQYLDIGSNNISSTIEDMMGAFSGLKKLLRLSLTSNKIKSINPYAFIGLQNLTSLDLSGNNIRSIQEKAFDTMPALQNLVLNTSSLVCDCNLQWFSNWLRDSKFLSIEARCAYPDNLYGKQLVHLSNENFTCGDSPKPYLIESPETKMALKGDNVSLRCHAKSSSPSEMTFKWKREKGDSVRELIGQFSITQFKSEDGRQTDAISELHLFNVTHNDAGKYQCVVENSFGTTYSSKAQISVSIFPSFTKYPKNMSVKVGETAKLQCHAHGQPTPVIAWQKDGGHDFPAARERRMHVIPSDDIFFIINAKHDDTGVYSCIANNSAGVRVANATLTVLEPPYFVKPMENRELIVGESIVLECKAGGVPKPVISWSKDGETLATTEKRHFLTAENQLLIIVETRMSDTGRYQCTLTNIIGSVTGHSNLTIVPMPVTLLRTGDMIGVIIITVVFCAVGTSIVWVVIIYQTRKRFPPVRTPLHTTTTTTLQQHNQQKAANLLENGLNQVQTPIPPVAIATTNITCVYTDNVSEHSSCKDSGMGDSAKRSSDDFLPAVDDYSTSMYNNAGSSGLQITNNTNNSGGGGNGDSITMPVESEQPLLAQVYMPTSLSEGECSSNSTDHIIRPTNHERLTSSPIDDSNHLLAANSTEDHCC